MLRGTSEPIAFDPGGKMPGPSWFASEPPGLAETGRLIARPAWPQG